MVSMVILNYNDWELTANYSQKIRSMNVVDHIVIVDNCSPDGSYDRLKDLQSEKIDVIQAESNGGYAKGNQLGVRFVTEHYGDEGIVIISNPDIEVDEQAIVDLKEALRENASLFAVTGLIYNLNDELIPLFTWRLPTVPMLFVNSCTVLRNLLFKFFGYGTKIRKNTVDFSQALIFCEALPGCFFAADLKKWNEIGGFCEKTFLFYEEDILFTKAKEQGMQAALVPSAKIRHLEGVTVKKTLNSWKKRELLLQDSCVVYMREALHKGSWITNAYKIWDRFWLPERYLFYKIKNRRG